MVLRAVVQVTMQAELVWLWAAMRKLTMPIEETGHSGRHRRCQ
jgi:hypothetical protein